MAIIIMRSRATVNWPLLPSTHKRLQSAFVEAVFMARALDNMRGDAHDRTAHAYPTNADTGSGPSDLTTRVRTLGIRVGPGGMGCPACADNVRADSPSHNRDPLSVPMA